MSKKCKNCGTILDDDALFCSECGVKQEPVEKKCNKCGSVLTEGAKFCMSCGTPVATAAATPAPAPSPSKQESAEFEVSQPDENTLSFNIKGVSFNMKLIKGGMLGEDIEISDFYIGETVVTQALWQTVTGNNPSEDNSDINYPVTGIGLNNVKAFLTRLKKIVGTAFDIPTGSQFKYAALKGCEKMSKAEFDEMSWGDEEWHPVCGMMPNHLGLYDMCYIHQAVQDEVPDKKNRNYRFNPKYKEGEYGASLESFEKVDFCYGFSTLRLLINIPVPPEVEKAKYEAVAKRKAEEQAKLEEEKRLKREEEERKKAEEQAKRDEARRKKREEEERLKAEETARKEEEERRRKEEEARREEEKKKRQEEKKKWEAEHPELVEERKRKEKEKKAQQAQKAKETKAKEAAKQAAIEEAKKKIMENGKLCVVDLGLSVKWASLNLGASKPIDLGEYYAWGETETKDVYNWEEYELSEESDNSNVKMFAKTTQRPELAQKMWKYCTDSSHGEVDNLSVLEPEDDAAAANMRNKLRFWEKCKWRMATIEEWNELKAKCEWVWTNINGRNGYLVIAKNGNCIFLPAAGYKTGDKLYGINGAIRYWSSSLNKESNYRAHAMEECPDNPLVVINWDRYRYLGLSIRAVQE